MRKLVLELLKDGEMEEERRAETGEGLGFK